ncbi:hypothetical protein [Oryzobacter telluris]|uniref:hypothetical protein n=1 Tax=Oryzobacter telluris TaxID=3149179 RepID=UPI00370D277A
MTTETSTAENPTAGQGPVLLDIGGDVGALIVSMPAHTRGLEVEIRPRGATAADAHAAHHHHDHSHDHGDDGDHAHGHAHDHAPSRYPHVGVVERTTAEGTSFSLVYPSVVAGEYELCPLPEGEVAATASITGGEVTQLAWPA